MSESGRKELTGLWIMGCTVYTIIFVGGLAGTLRLFN
jgi:hypothetical protein